MTLEILYVSIVGAGYLMDVFVEEFQAAQELSFTQGAAIKVRLNAL